MKITDFPLMTKAECAYQLAILDSVPFEKVSAHCGITAEEFSMFLLGIHQRRYNYERING